MINFLFNFLYLFIKLILYILIISDKYSFYFYKINKMKNISCIKSAKISNSANYNNQFFPDESIKIKPNTSSNSIADSLTFFVDNSNTIKFINDPPKKAFTRKFSKDKLYKSIYQQDIFSREKERKKFTKKIKNYETNPINENKFNRSINTMGNLLNELKINCYDKVIKRIEDAENIKDDLEKNCDFLMERIKKTKYELNNYKIETDEIKNDSDKIYRLKDRIKSESNYINTEVPAKEDIIFNNKENTIIKSNCFSEEKQINFYQDEIEILRQKIKQLDKEKQKLRYDIISLKKKTDPLKENLKMENIKVNSLAHGLEHLIYSSDN